MRRRTPRDTGERSQSREHPARRTRSHHASGFSLVEAVISIFIVGVTLVAAMNTVGAAQSSKRSNAQRERALLLAQDLMAEIINKAYEEPDDTPTFGRESGESGSQRDAWDDVDDYHGLSDSPPESPDGTAIPWADGYTREVACSWLDPNNLNQASGTESGVKGVRVVVKHGDRVLVTLSAMRAQAWQDPKAQ